MLTVLWQGFALGLSSGTFCLASCAPGIVPTLLLEERSGRWVHWAHVGKFLAGRLLAYLLVGWAGGYVGMRFGGGLPPWAFGWAWMVLAALLIGQGIVRWSGGGGRAISQPRWSGSLPFVIGLLLGLSPCMPFWLALTAVLERGQPLEGTLLFGAFFLATSLFFLPLGFLGRLSQHATVRYVARWTTVLVGVIFFVIGLERLLT